MNYITVEHLKTVLNITNTDKDSFLQNIIDRAKSIIDSYIGYSFEETTQTQFLKGNHLTKLYVSKKPITDIDYIKEDGLEISFLDFNGSMINLANPTYSDSSIEIRYTAGYPDGGLPREIEQACLDICTDIYRQSEQSENIKTKKIDTLSIEYFSKTDMKNQGLDAFKILDRYKILDLF